MHCSVVIPCHNGAALTRACIASLLSQEGGPPHEILLVDNGSGDETPQLDGLGDGRVHVLRQDHNRGFAGGVNVGIRAATGELVLILNNDTQAAPNLLHELTKALLSDARLGAVAPRSNHVKGHAHLAIGDQGKTLARRRELAAELGGRPSLQDMATLAGLCLLVRRATFDEIGLFDERFGHGNFEDDDLCLRLRLHGYRLAIAGRAFLHHEGHATFRSLGIDLETEIAHRRAQFIDKWQQDPAGRAYLASWDGDVEGAARAAQDARLLWPLWPDADWHLGQWHHAQGNHRRAEAHFRALLRTCPHHSDTRFALARCLLAARRLEDAEQAMQDARNDALSPVQQRHLLTQLGSHAYYLGRHEDALAAFAVALEFAPQDGALHNWVGLCHLAAGRIAEAVPHFERATEAGFELAHTNLGICLARLGDVNRARTSFARAVLLLPKDSVARQNLAACNALA